jgi:myo-inositol 2-dehydrogenase/D-chiro-inositol 1-dehydrogenase
MLEGKINVGIVGLGYAKQVLIPALEETNLFNIVGLSDSKETYQTLKILGLDYSKVPWSDLVKNSQVDLILIGVPAKLHTKFTIDALEHGKKVFCEKPFGNLRDIQAVHKKNFPILENRIFVGYQFRFDPMILELYKILLTSNINQKIVINIDWISDGGKRFLNSNLQPNNIWFDFGSHIFDYLNFLILKSWLYLVLLHEN